jgi:hypothetical protein
LKEKKKKETLTQNQGLSKRSAAR